MTRKTKISGDRLSVWSRAEDLTWGRLELVRIAAARLGRWFGMVQQRPRVATRIPEACEVKMVFLRLAKHLFAPKGGDSG